MRIAILCPISLRAPGGATQRILRLVDKLKEYAEVHFISLGKDNDRVNGLNSNQYHYVESRRFPKYRNLFGLIARKSKVMACHRLGRLENIDFWFDESWKPQLLDIARHHKFDIVIAEYVFASKGLSYFRDTIKIIDTHDIFHRRQQFEGEKHNNWFQCYNSNAEAKGWRRADIVIGIQDQESAMIRELAPHQKVRTVGHPLDLNFCYNPDVEDRIGFIASASHSNCVAIEQFIEGPLKDIRGKRPKTELVIAGGICDGINNHQGVRKIGFVDKLESFYSNISFAINPITQGTGLKIKTIEALEHGCPILCSNVGLEGIDDLACEGLIRCQSPEDWLSNSEAWLSNTQKKNQASKSLKFTATSYRDNVFQILNELIHQIKDRNTK